MRKPRALLDCDGVVCNFLTPALGILNRLTGLSRTEAELREWDILTLYPAGHKEAFFNECNQPGFCASLPLLPNAVEFVTELRQVAEVFIVTSPMNTNPTWVWEREQWLGKHFGFTSKQIVHTSAKHLCVGDVLIDDHPGNIEAWELAHGPKGTGLLWDAPYNRESKTGRRVSSSTDVVDFLKSLQLGA